MRLFLRVLLFIFIFSSLFSLEVCFVFLEEKTFSNNMILKILSIIGALLILVIFLYLIRKTLLFLLGMVLLFAGSAGVVVGGLLIFVKCFYFYGPGVIFLSVIFVLFGKEMIGKANTVKIPDHASEDGSNMDQTEGRIVAGRNLYDRHYGSSFGSGF